MEGNSHAYDHPRPDRRDDWLIRRFRPVGAAAAAGPAAARSVPGPQHDTVTTQAAAPGQWEEAVPAPFEDGAAILTAAPGQWEEAAPAPFDV
jgi:hypothetical protein